MATVFRESGRAGSTGAEDALEGSMVAVAVLVEVGTAAMKNRVLVATLYVIVGCYIMSSLPDPPAPALSHGLGGLPPVAMLDLHSYVPLLPPSTPYSVGRVSMCSRLSYVSGYPLRLQSATVVTLRLRFEVMRSDQRSKAESFVYVAEAQQ